MDHITVHKIKELAQVNEPQCISVFIPTYRAGMEVNEKIDQKNLKNQVKKARNELEALGLKEREIEGLIKPLNDLVENTGFWKLQSDGLAIFRNRDMFEYYTLPVPFEPLVHVADHFYPMPLIPYINNGIKFYLLTISQRGVKFFEGFPHQINEVDVKDLLPERLEEVVGFDFEEKHLNIARVMMREGGQHITATALQARKHTRPRYLSISGLLTAALWNSCTIKNYR
jgi:hypothetical protein